ncbi:MAG: helix-turn-helix transcriptional regulator, partial [Kiritimatiellae bacterium]|nr:helix-turn-helix transcriptional regulator [Kiritimatiellia bacterium]
PFGAAEIAAALEVPRIRLDRLFAAELNRSAGKEILRQRLAKAKQLLVETDDTLAAIASSCGFCHASYLINAFKKATGTTPHRYRRNPAPAALRPRPRSGGYF